MYFFSNSKCNVAQFVCANEYSILLFDMKNKLSINVISSGIKKLFNFRSDFRYTKLQSKEIPSS
jgi:hypothetical protein